jgi:hypothetical protein
VTGGYVIADMTQDYLAGRSVTVASGENVPNINFDLLLAATIKGQIKDADGYPVVSERLNLIVAEKDQTSSSFQAHGIKVRPSDAQGNYSLDNVPPGRYLLRNEHPEMSTVTTRTSTLKRLYPLTYYPATSDQKSATIIEVAPGAVLTGIDIVVGAPLKTYQIAGRVVDEVTGAPVPKVGFEIDLYVNGSGYGSGGLKTDSDGQFIIPAALPGHFRLRPTANAGDNLYGDGVEFDIVDKDMTGLEVKMHHGATLSGKVIVDGLSGASDLQKLLKEKYFLWLEPSDARIAGSRQAFIDADGNFQFVGMRPGLVKVSVRRFNGQNEFSILKIKRDDQDVTGGIELASTDELSGLQVIVQSNGKNIGTIRGQLKVEGGDLEGVHPYVNYCRVDVAPSQCGAAMLDTRQRFVVEKAQPGEYQFVIGPMTLTVSNEAGSKTMQRMPTVKQTAKVTAGAESEVTLVMKLNPQ